MNKKMIKSAVFITWLFLIVVFACWARTRASDDGRAVSDFAAPSRIEASEDFFADNQARRLLNAARLTLKNGARTNDASDKPAEQVFKNIKVLTGTPSSQLYAMMNFMRVSLGVQCNFCHVRTSDGKWIWESDEKPEKQTTRRMIQMVLDLNKANFNGRTTVSCYTCHRNQRDPINMPPVNAPMPNQTASAEAKPRETLPTAEQILAKYTVAIGGSEAIEKLKTRWAKGTLTAQRLSAAPFEIYQQAPNKYLFILTTPDGKVQQGFDGSRAWSGDAKGAQAASGEMLAPIKRNADFYTDLKLKEQFQRMRVIGKEKIGEHETYVVIGRTMDNRNERLFFDVDSGLLRRRITYMPTLIGQVPEITDYEDYRDVQGVKIAFVKRLVQLDNFDAMTFKLDEVRFNAPVGADQFNPPVTTK